MKKHYFNMIEIILAIAIIAIGISSIMGLFSSGLRIGNSATMSNNVPNAVDSLLAHVRVAVNQYGYGSFRYADYKDLSDDVKNKGWEDSPIFDKISSKEFKDDVGVGTADFETDSRLTVVPSADGKSFLYRQLTQTADGYVPEFSAVAEVRWLDSDEYNRIKVFSPANKITELEIKDEDPAVLNLLDGEGGVSRKKARKVFLIRISYPADSPPIAREKKFYRLEVFNDSYDRFVSVKP